MTVAHRRPTEVVVDLGAVAANVAALRQRVAPAEVCVVVKADGYGHGAVPVARAAVAAGARMLAVACAEEGVALREAGIDAPVLVLAEPTEADLELLRPYRLEPAVYREETVRALADVAAPADGPAGEIVVHLKVDTGMHRVGADPDRAVAVAKAIDDSPGLRLGSVWTHCAVADEPENPATAGQLARFADVVTAIAAAGFDVPRLHAANSAAAIAHPDARFDLVRAGIAVYGVAPSPALEGAMALRPAMTFRSRVVHVRRVDAGEGISYGHRYRLERPATIATVPAGYADGVPRPLGAAGGEVLIGGRRCPIAGNVTMDQLMVDCGDEPVEVGDEVVLLGAQGGERIRPEEWAERLGTIGYEIVTRIGTRVPRRYVGG